MKRKRSMACVLATALAAFITLGAAPALADPVPDSQVLAGSATVAVDASFNNFSMTYGTSTDEVNVFLVVASGLRNNVYHGSPATAMGGKTGGFLRLGMPSETEAGYVGISFKKGARKAQWTTGESVLFEFSICPGFSPDNYVKAELWTHPTAYASSMGTGGISAGASFTTSQANAVDTGALADSKIYLAPDQWSRVRITATPESNNVLVSVNGAQKTYTLGEGVTAAEFFATARIHTPNPNGETTYWVGLDDLNVMQATPGFDPLPYNEPSPQIDEANPQVVSGDIALDAEEPIVYRKQGVSNSAAEGIFGDSHDAVYVSGINKIAVWEKDNVNPNPKYFRVFDEGEFEFISLTKSGSVATATVRAFGETPEPGIMLAAFYGGGEMKNLVEVPQPASYNGKTPIVFDTATDATPGVELRKVFYWNSLSALVPHAACLDF